MEEKKKSPQLRFAGFTDDWEEYELKDICESFEYGLNAAAKDFDGTNKYLRITDIGEESREFILKGLTSPNCNLEDAEGFLLKEGDVLFARTGASVGKTYLYRPKDGVVYFAGFLIRGRVKQEFSSELVFQYTLTENYKKYIHITSQRSGQPGVNAQEYGFFPIKLPTSGDEQRQIGSFFKNIDELITKHQKKHDRLVTLKKSMLEKMFPKEGQAVPEIRFKGFEGEWIFMSVDQIADRFDNLRVPIKAELRVSGSTPYYGANGIQGFVKGFTHKGEYVLVAEDGANDIKNYPIQYVNGEVWVNNHAHVLQAKKSIAENLFLKYALTRVNIEPFLTGGGRAKLNAEVMMKIDVSIPHDLNEQKKLGGYFQNIETLIDKHDKQLKKLTYFKKSLLEKMFV